jgi:ABC-type antimicrobial peptide transport system permease subunit
MGPLSSLSISSTAVLGSIVIALLVGLIAGAWPAYQAMRLHTIDALRKVA